MTEKEIKQLCEAIKSVGNGTFQSNREVRDKIEAHLKGISDASNFLGEKLNLLTDAINESSKQSQKSSIALSRITLVMAIATVVMAILPIIKFFIC